MRCTAGFAAAAAFGVLAVAPGMVRGEDVVRLHRGDVLVGRFVSLGEGELVFETEYADKLTIARELVAGIQTDEAVTVRCRDGSRRSGMLIEGQEGIRLVEADAFETAVDLSAVESILRPEVEPPYLRWRANADLGLELRTGNTEKRELYASGEVRHSFGKNATQLEGEIEREIKDGDLKESNWEVAAKYERSLVPPWYALLGVRYEHDESDDLDARVALLTGLGYNVFDRAMYTVGLEMGPGYILQDFEGVTAEDFPVGRGALNGEVRFLGNRVRISNETFLVGGLADSERFVVRTETLAGY